MKGYLLDTNVISELLRKRPSEMVLQRLRTVPREELYSSAVSIMELRFGAARHPRGRRLWERMQDEVLSRLSILPVGVEEATKAGEVLAELEAAGTPIGVEDVLIGSTALVRELKVATRNTKHLSRIRGLRVENWWR
ncbi:MAG: PIN domain-containing protein [Nitrospinota bacterium]